MRQMHHWSAMLFIAAMMVHLLRVFFTGAFRKPRELNWVIGCLLLLLGTLEGFTGYSLPDDLLSGTGIRAADGFMKSMPVVGTYMSFFLFGGEFPGEAIIPRLYIVHVLLIPGILLALIGAHMLLLVYHKHTQWPGPGRTEQNVVGFPLMPVYAAKAGGFFFIVFGVTALMGGLLSINPVWKYGPYDPSKVTAGSQPDWYMGWPDGALRIMPGLGVPLPRVHPVLERLPADHRAARPDVHDLADAAVHRVVDHRRQARTTTCCSGPRNAPTRTATMVALMTFYGLLWAAGGNDIIAITFDLSINQITYFMRVAVFVGPLIAFYITRRWCISLQRHGQREAPARLRDGRDHALARGRLLREAPPAARGDRPRARRPRPATRVHGGVGDRRERRGGSRTRARPGCGPRSRPRCTPTTCSRRPPRSSRRRTTTPSTSTSCRRRWTASRPTGTSSTTTTGPSRTTPCGTDPDDLDAWLPTGATRSSFPAPRPGARYAGPARHRRSFRGNPTCPLVASGCAAPSSWSLSASRWPAARTAPPSRATTRRSPEGDQPAAAEPPAPTPVQVSTRVGSDAGAVPLDQPVRVQARDGRLRSVSVTSDAGDLPGTLSADGASWVADGRLEPGTTYRVDTVALRADGKERRTRSSFSTVDLTLDEQTYPSIAPLAGETVGVGMPVIVTFDVPVTDRASIEKHLKVTSVPKQRGSWHWLSGQEVHWRPAKYWQAGTDVTVDADINSIPAGAGIFGQESRQVSFHVGDAVVSKVNAQTHQMQTFINGQLARTTPITTGKPGFTTRSGRQGHHREVPRRSG